MKKIFYITIILFVSVFFFNNKLDALIISQDEAKEEAKVVVGENEEVDNIYIVGDYIFVNSISKEEIELARNTKTDAPIIKYDTLTEVWSIVGSEEEAPTNLEIKYDKERNIISIDHIYSEEELRSSLEDTNINKIILEEDLKDINERFVVDRVVEIEGNNKTLTFTDKINTKLNNDRHGMLITSNGVKVNNLNIFMSSVDKKWNGVYAIEVFKANNVTLDNLKLTNADAGLLVNDSTVTLKEKVNVTNNEFGGIEVSNNNAVLNATESTLVNETESYGLPTIWTDEVSTLSQNVVVNVNNMYANLKVVNNQIQYYLKEENSFVTKIEVINNEEMLPVKDYTKDDKITTGNASFTFTSTVPYDKVKIVLKEVSVPEALTKEDVKIKIINEKVKDFIKEGYKFEHDKVSENTNITKELFIEAKRIGVYKYKIALINIETEEEIATSELNFEVKDVFFETTYEEEMNTSETLVEPTEIDETNSNIELELKTNKEKIAYKYLIDNLLLPEGVSIEEIRLWAKSNSEIIDLLEGRSIDLEEDKTELILETKEPGVYSFDVSLVAVTTEEEISKKTIEIEFEVLEETTEEN